MGDITMKPGDILPLLVTKKVENVKSWKRGDAVVYRHDIYLTDKKTGNTSVKQWVPATPSIPLTIFVEGVVQYIKCVKADPKGDEIEPYDPEDQGRMVPIVSRNTLPTGTSEQTTQAPFNCNDKNIGGKSITFCMAYAKDLKVAELAGREDKKITEDDIEDVAKWAIKINEKICEFLNF